jgi:hypothetical protein
MNSNIKHLIVAIALGLILLSAWILLMKRAESGSPLLAASDSNVDNTESQPRENTPQIPYLVKDSKTFKRASSHSEPAPPLQKPTQIEQTSSPLSIALSTISEQYQYQNRFATGTTALSDKDFHLLNPNHSYDIKFPVGASQQIQATLVLNQYQYVPGDTLSARLSFSDEIQLSDLYFVLSDQGQTLMIWPYSQAENHNAGTTNHQSKATTQPIVFKWLIPNSLDEAWVGEKQFSVRFKDEEGFTSTLTQGIKLSPITATLTAFSDAIQQERFIKIYFSLDVKISGSYRIKANVFDGAKPIVHLNQKFKQLPIGEYQGYLTIDSFALYEAQVQQPLKLTQIQVEQLPRLPGDKTLAGKAEVNEYPIPLLNSEAFSRQPIENAPTFKLSETQSSL